MRKIIEQEISYYDPKDKELKKTTFKIEVIPRIVVRDYNKISEVIDKIKELNKRLQFLKDECGTLIFGVNEQLKDIKDRKQKKDIKKSTKEKIEEYTTEIKFVTAQMNEIDVDKFEADRVRLMKIILERNGIKDELFHTDEFWYECVDIHVLNSFLESVVAKDLGGQVKKKALKDQKS